MKILIVNTHSTLNFGDSGILIAQIKFLKNYFTNLSITLTSRTPKIDEKLYHPMGIRVLPPIFPAPSIYSESHQKIFEYIKNLLVYQTKIDLFAEIKKCDLMISSGGGCFWSNRQLIPGPMFFQNYFHIKLASLLKKPVIFFPQSFGPFYNSIAPKILGDILKSEYIIKIFAREKASFDFLNNLLGKRDNKERIEFCPDMGFFLQLEEGDVNKYKDFDLPKPIIAVTLREWEFPEVKNSCEKKKRKALYLDALYKICRKIIFSWGGSIVIFPMARGPGAFENDIAISKELFKRLKNVMPKKSILLFHFPAVVSPFHIIRILSKVDLVIATRFHSAIFAFLSGIPTVSIGYQPKSIEIMKLMGLERYCVNISEICAERIFELITEIRKNQPEIKAEIKIRVRETQKAMITTLEKSISSFYQT